MIFLKDRELFEYLFAIVFYIDISLFELFVLFENLYIYQIHNLCFISFDDFNFSFSLTSFVIFEKDIFVILFNLLKLNGQTIGKYLKEKVS